MIDRDLIFATSPRTNSSMLVSPTSSSFAVARSPTAAKCSLAIVRSDRVVALPLSQNGPRNMKNDMSDSKTKQRADLFRYVSLEVTDSTLRATYELDGRIFVETVAFEGVDSLHTPAVTAVAQLWFLLAGLSYYKAGAARRVDVGSTPLGDKGEALLRASLREGLAEFAYRNDLWLDDVVITGGVDTSPVTADIDTGRVLVPFGGGIDSVVTTSQLAPSLHQSLF